MSIRATLGGCRPPCRLPVVALDDCCSTVTGGVLDADTAERLARSFKALGDPTRVRLLSLIAATDGGEACICDLTGPVGLSQPTVSHHMRQARRGRVGEPRAARPLGVLRGGRRRPRRARHRPHPALSRSRT
nr:metalloregulator ArsR/SmtB family transcription factor [Angustibacter aerolatus]